MGNSTVKLQDIVDSASTIAELQPVFVATSGFASEPALTIANAVMSDLIAQRFNPKWNRIRIAPFPLTSNQQDYPSVQLRNLGWLESAAIVDQNNTSFPKPTRPIETVRDLPISSDASGWPGQVASLPNSLMEYGSWPGPGFVYVNPIGAVAGTPNNQPTAIQDANGVILTLTTYGTTGATPPVAPNPPVIGTPVVDGSAAWTICDPGADGFRVDPRPASGGNVWVLRIFAQAKAVRFTSLSQTLDPIPDDYSNWFQTGFTAYAHRYSSNPAMQGRWMAMRQEWLEALTRSIQESNREPTVFGFVPDRPLMDPGGGFGPSVGYPYPGRRRY